ncbi:MAG: glucosaminidase domain-containing protein [Bacteroidetes bacterium]|nr:glucosaminidase domain-containing protein [Bacteroidota bacterium]
MLKSLAKVNTFFIIIFLLSSNASYAQRGNDADIEVYITNYKTIAVQKMREFKIPASITLAQGILESGIGNSVLARKANNHFGIKCHGNWKGKKYYQDDDHKNECFRKYNSPEESFMDHSLFLTKRHRYARLFKLDITDYKAWAYGLKKSGYATNPKYPELLIRIIEENYLYYLDRDIEPMIVKQNHHPIPVNGSSYPSKKSYRFVEFGPNEREIYENNGLKFIYAKKGDTFSGIAKDFNIYTWQVYTYNDLKKSKKLKEGQIIYLEKKKNKAKQPFHIVKAGESMHYIAQLYGVKLKKLLKTNNMTSSMYPYMDQKIKLQ